ncbi:solute carrier family 15 member 4-like [Haliotis rufescens]|uniref:solute carrier family 15 member 4-like n=1 Tax=Haliotis rufescens TaxID=6454 RepID=UPI00201EF5CE|nr:solute carrier family 15 member 4-like [Haliotis rufescens]
MSDERRALLPRRNEELSLGPTRTRNSLWSVRSACGAILLSVVLERLAFYALAGNLVLFLNSQPFTWESYHAMNASFYFLGLSFVTSLFGGWLADSVFGRFKAIIVALVIYIVGYAFMPLLSPKDDSKSLYLPDVCRIHNVTPISHRIHTHDFDLSDSNDKNPFDEKCAWLIFIVLTVIAVGNGSFKANIAPFGADQVNQEGQQVTLGFFNWFYWCVNLGAFIGLLAITWVEQMKSFFYGYLSACVCLSVGAIIFILGGCCYVRRPAAGSILTNIFRIIREAFRMRRRRRRDYRTKSITGGKMVDEAEPLHERLSFLDYAKHRHGGVFHDSLVEDVKELKKVLCVFAVLIPYWMVYFQMQTTFLVQGLHMKLMFHLNESNDDPPHPQLVVAWFSLFDVVFLILLLPLFDRVIYPRLAKAGRPFGMTKRIIVGMVFAMAAMIVAGVVEHYRLEAFWPYPNSTCTNHSINQKIGNTTYQAADFSILWQIPQYALIGTSEVFTSVAGLQFAYSMAPKSMKGIIMGLFYFSSGIGSFLGTAFISGFYSTNTWFHSSDFGDINCRLACEEEPKGDVRNQACHLDYYFYLLAGVELVGLILFIVVAKVFKLGVETQQRLQVGSSEPFPPEAKMTDAKDGRHSIQRTTSNLSS